MTRGELRETTRLLLGETLADGFSDSEIDTQINTAQIRVAIDAKPNTTFTDLTLVNFDQVFPDPDDSRAQGRYGMPDDLLAITDLELIEAGVKTWPIKTDLKDLLRRYATDYGSKPRRYAIAFGATEQTAPTRGDIWFRPLPEKDYTARVHYVQRPSAMTDDTNISELPEFSHEAICYKAAQMLSFKFKNRDLLIQMTQLYNDALASVITMVHHEDMTGPIQIRNVYRRRRHW
jgi:hypothetical protein